MAIDNKISKVTISRYEGLRLVNVFRFELNPGSLEYSFQTNWVDLRAPGTTGNQAMFVNVGEFTIPLTFTITQYSSQQERGAPTVRQRIAEIVSWGLPSLSRFASQQNEYIPPPTLRLAWGSRTWRCTARNIKVRETMHTPDGEPLVAEIDVELKTDTASFEELYAWMQQWSVERLPVELPLNLDFDVGP